MPPVNAIIFWVLSAAWSYHGEPMHKFIFLKDYETCETMRAALLTPELPPGMSNLTVKCSVNWAPSEPNI
jgi:hypothetical protein